MVSSLALYSNDITNDINVVPLQISENVNENVFLIIGTCDINYSIKLIKKLLISHVKPIIIQPRTINNVKELINQFHNKIEIISRDFNLSDLTTFGRILVNKVVDKVFINLLPTSPQELDLINTIFNQCIKLRIPINTLNLKEFSTFNLPFNFQDQTNNLQISIDNYNSSPLSLPIPIQLLNERLLRHLTGSIPHDFKKIYQNVANLYDEIYKNNYNVSTETLRQQLLWLNQNVEYSPLSNLKSLTITDLTSRSLIDISTRDDSTALKKIPNSNGTLSLVGTGPGSLSMLTLGAIDAMKSADLIVADKLIPQEILSIVPSDIDIFTAKKFPGNANNAQVEINQIILNNLEQGKHVVRLKQGDPYVFGRGGEEFLKFHKLGYSINVVSGITSPLACTLVSDIPATMRNYSDSILICTGTGQNGTIPDIPEYNAKRTTIFLMCIHRIEDLYKGLNQKGWDDLIDVAIVERASCTDQRITRTKLKYVVQTIKEIGSRPPGLIIMGKVVNVLVKEKDQKYIQFNDDWKYWVKEGCDSASNNFIDENSVKQWLESMTL
ncbi:hypothetical protein TBLA_0A09440 [Henningerozyma blattae CBS 6284]|uniref:uroporphyrinogen-III C-methyltransferase n=1 Tax=Henningerozyma blattae (strain ATCC 34711 / CBS 6284 / DSM 70876 / NBRC 10599 / NRRL Y-10934 / UCD 77-7) TaxID=1071380 RepID=I2GX77_HENB6|nr:hypothetical protein TBLA_0A09440 [Tetrapisispora blattae CBS 6284]CCH58729.1 hypothetical protein TBLA_0A09440 [Tetrapisispora blattae CBS 6284]